MIVSIERNNYGWVFRCRCGFSGGVREPNPFKGAEDFLREAFRAGSRFELQHAHANPVCKPDEEYVTLPQITDIRLKL